MNEPRQTVLIIDDNDAVRTALEVLLSLHGLCVLGAASPEAGLECMMRRDIDVVIQDHCCPNWPDSSVAATIFPR